MKITLQSQGVTEDVPDSISPECHLEGSLGLG